MAPFVRTTLAESLLSASHELTLLCKSPIIVAWVVVALQKLSFSLSLVFLGWSSNRSLFVALCSSFPRQRQRQQLAALDDNLRITIRKVQAASSGLIASSHREETFLASSLLIHLFVVSTWLSFTWLCFWFWFYSPLGRLVLCLLRKM